MIKIFDTTFLSAADHEMVGIDLMPIVCSCYNSIIPKGVYSECESYVDKSIKVFTTDDERFNSANEYLKRRHEGLGPGERTTMITSLFLTENGIDNYIVTDDLLARRLIEKLHLDLQLVQIFGHSLMPIKSTGTIGIVLRLHDHGLLTNNDLCNIANDLEKSSFRVRPDLLDILKNQK